MSPKPKEQGIALISVFWVLIILSVMALTVLSIGRTQRGLSSNNLMVAQAELSAEAGINFVISELSSRNAVQKIPNEVSERSYNFSGSDLSIKITPEEGKIDLNTTDPIFISALLAYYRVAENKAQQIEDEIRQKRKQLSDDKFYSVMELKELQGFPTEILPCIEPYLTVYSQRNGVDLNLASDDMNALVNWADTKRWGGQSWLETTGNSTNGLVSGRNSVLQNLRSYSGRAFTIKATANASDKVKISKRAVVRITGNIREPFWTYEWKSGYSRSDAECAHL